MASAYAALLAAVRDRIRSGLAWANKDCEVMADGRPKPSCGLFFVAVHRGPRVNPKREATHLEQAHVVCVTVSWRHPGPADQAGLKMYAAGGLDERCDAIIGLLMQDSLDYATSNAADALLGDPHTGQPPHGFRLALRYLNDDPPAEKRGDWFGAEPDGKAAGWAQTLYFTATRWQHLGNLTP